MLIAIVNNSSSVKDAEVQLMVDAIQIQLDLHVFPAWNLKGGTIRFYADKTKVPGYAWVISIIENDAQVAGALGYHQEETSGKIDGYIMCQPILTNGGTVLAFDPANPGQYSVSATLSHECLEALNDPYINKYHDNGNTSWCGELCDPVEQIGYGIMVNGTNVAVSDFVFPSFFNQYATATYNMPFNYLKTLKAPFTILPGGYAIQRDIATGNTTQVFGEAMPEWRRDMKKTAFSRAMKRFK